MKEELKILLDSIVKAGCAIESIRKKGYPTTLKQDQSPLTDADLLANAILKQELLENFPQDGWLSEETKDNLVRLNCKRVWIVDPIDGTKEFTQNIPEYAISVALVESGSPILSAVYNPNTEQLFYAVKNEGAWCNGKQIYCLTSGQSKLSLLASRTEFKNGLWEDIKKENEVKIVGSIAYKLALVAKGEAHATISLAPKNEWDIAAGILLVQEAQGKTTDASGNEIHFNQKKTNINGLIAASKNNFPSVFLISQKANQSIR